MNKKLTLEDFINISNKKHNFKYDYRQSIYLRSDKLINIICPNHGLFTQLAKSHMSGAGCNKCAIDNRRKTTDQFILDAQKVFNHKYDYFLTEYVSAYSNIKIICKIHNVFIQKAHDHLSGYGCPKCKADKIGNLKRMSIDDFIIKSNSVHNFKYDYSEIKEIKNQKDIVKIICPTHGSFNQMITNHLSNHGCPKCANSISKVEIKWLDNLNIDQNHRQKSVKINNKAYKVDAYNPITNTVYEFYGDFWHGNPNIYNLNDLNHVVKKTFGELYNKTIAREDRLKSAGFTIISVWEADFLNKKEIFDIKKSNL